MSSALPPLPLGDPLLFVRRTYGSSSLCGEGDMLAFAFNAEGHLWSLEEPGILRRWDLQAQEELEALSLEELASLWQIDSQARLLAGASDEIILWELPSGDETARFPAVPAATRPGEVPSDEPNFVTALAFHPEGKIVAAGYDDGVIRIWDLAKPRQPVRTLGQPGSEVSALAYDPQGNRLAAAYEDRLIRLWDTGSGTTTASLEGHTDRIPALVWHPDGQRLISAGWDTTARVWDTVSLEPIILLNAHQGQVFSCALSLDGRFLACADSGNAVHLWNLDDYRELGTLRDRCAAEIHALVFSPNNRRLVFGGIERVINQWDVTRPQQEANQLGDPQLNRTAVAVRDQGRKVVSLGMGTGPRQFDATSGEPVPTWTETHPLRALACSPCGRYIAGSLAPTDAPNDSKKTTPLMMWDADTTALVSQAEEQGQPITALVFSPRGDRLASASYQSSNVWLWTVPGLEPILLINNAVEGFAVESVAFHPEGELLAIASIDYLSTSGRDGQVEIYDPRTTTTLTTIPGGASAVTFTPDGRRVVVASIKLALQIVDWATGAVVQTLRGPSEPINALTFSPDGTLLAVGSDDHTIRLYDGKTFAPRAALELDEQIKALAFSPDGKFLYTGNGNGTAYQLEVEQLLLDAATEPMP